MREGGTENRTKAVILNVLYNTFKFKEMFFNNYLSESSNSRFQSVFNPRTARVGYLNQLSIILCAQISPKLSSTKRQHLIFESFQSFILHGPL